jgi:hypothetical protein
LFFSRKLLVFRGRCCPAAGFPQLSGRQEHAQGFGSVSYIKDSLLLLVLSFAAGLGLHLCQVAAAGLCSRRKFTRGFGLRDLLFASRILLAGQF